MVASAVRQGRRGQGVDRDRGEQVAVGGGDRVLVVRGLHRGGEGPQPLAGAVEGVPLGGVGGGAGEGGEGDVGAVVGDRRGEGAELGEQRPAHPVAGEGGRPGRGGRPPAVRAGGEVSVQQVPPGGQGGGDLVEAAGQRAGRAGTGPGGPRRGGLQQEGGVAEGAEGLSPRLFPRGGRRGGAVRHVAEGGGGVLGVAGEEGDHAQQAAGHLVHIAPRR